MSAPVPDFDQLLSDHLDGCLDEVQTQMLAESLRRDPALQAQLDAMQRDREALRNLFAAPASPASSLPTDFAARVLAESRRRGLHTDNPAHPRPLETPKSRTPWQLIAGGFAIAASLLIVASLSWIGRTPDAGVQALAHNQAASETPKNQSIESPAPAPAPAPASPAQVKVDPLPMVAGRESQSPATEDAMPASPEIGLRRISPKPSLDAVASAAPAAHADAAMANKQSSAVAVTDDEQDMLFNAALTGAMMVYDVRLTPAGRERGAVTRAIQRNGLGESHRQPISRDVIAAAKQADTFDEDEKYQVIYLQAPAKKVDRVFLDLLQDGQEVQSVGLTLVTDMPLLQLAGRAIHVDATQVKHDRPLSVDLGGNADDAELDSLRELLGNQVFMPLSVSDASAPEPDMDTLSSPSNDVMTRVLILVR